jgi:hypothetical protein
MRQPGEIALLSGAVLAAFAAGAWMLFRKRPTPEERERLRRLMVNRNGRMGDGSVTDINGDSIYYSYRVRGVEYMASQDISALHDRLPTDPSILVGPVTLKYMPSNPVESILVCEEWSGFRTKETTSHS